MTPSNDRPDISGSAVRVAVVGCGHIGLAVHIPSLLSIPGVRVVAVADTDASRRAAAAQRAPGARAVQDLEAVLAGSDVDAVVVCLPSAMHDRAALRVLESGRALYLEKPLASTLADGRALVARWKAAKVPAMMGLNYRFNPLHESMRRAIASGALGSPLHVRTVFATSPGSMPGWKQRRGSGGGVLLDLGTHHFDLLGFLLGQSITEISARVVSRRTEADTAVVTYRLGTGADAMTGESFFSFAAADQDCFEIIGERGRVVIDRYRSFGVRVQPLQLEGRLGALWRDGVSAMRSGRVLSRILARGNEPSFRLAIQRFVDAARGIAQASPDLADGLRALEVVHAAEESASTGATIAVVNA